MDAVTEKDPADMTDEELAERAQSLEKERARRAVITDAERRTDQMCLDYLRAAGREQGAPYEPPLGFIGSYPRGWRVTHDGKAYEATAPGVAAAPPAEGWVEVDPGDTILPFWEPGTYDKDTILRDAGQVWRALADATDGPRPSEFPGGWTPTL